MADAMTDSFLEGQGIPVDLREIETEMTKLWGPAAEQVGRPGAGEPERHADRAGEPGGRVPGWGRRGAGRGDGDGHRAVPLPGDRGASGRTIPGVGSRPRSRRCAICRPRACRRSAPSGSCSAPGRMPSTCSPAPCGPCSRPSCRWSSGGPATRGRTRHCSATWPTSARGWSSTCRTPGPISSAIRMGLDPALCPFSRDVAWFGLTRWRELVAQFFDPPCPSGPWVGSTRSTSRPSRPSRSGRLGSPSGWRPGWPVSSAGSPRAGRSGALGRPRARLDAEFLGPRGTIPVRITTRPAGAATRRSPA